MTPVFEFQDPGEGIREAEVLDILVSEGEAIEEGQDLFVVETDKAAFELASPRRGRVGEIVVHEGDRIGVGDVLLRYADAQSEREPGVETREARAEDTGSSDPRAGARRGGTLVRATPAIRRLARELEVDLHEVEPSGAEGRVLAADVRRRAEGRGGGARPVDQENAPGGEGVGEESRRKGAANQASEATRDRFGTVERSQLRSVRRRTAERMAVSWAEVARVTHHDEADVTELERLRRRLEPTVDGHLTWTVLLLKAVASLLGRHPRFNASYDGESGTLTLKRYVNVGVAVDTERGLLVPVVRNAPAKSLRALTHELTALVDEASDGSIQRERLVGGTFTLTNVGPIGGTGLTPLVNPPEVAILGVGQAHLAPVVRGTLDDHETEVRLMLPLSLSFDHRVLDGAEAARFVRDLTELLCDPDRFLVET